MSEQTANRRVAAAGALLVALAVVGLGFFLGDTPEEKSPAPGALSRTGSAPSGTRKAARPEQTSGSRLEAHEGTPPARREPGPNGVLEVEVFSPEDAPVRGASIQIYERQPADPQSFPARWSSQTGGETGADGRLALAVPPGSYYVTARAQELAPGYAAIVHPPGGARTRLRLQLRAGAELVGFTLAKSTGEPVSLAEIILTPPSSLLGPQGNPDAPEEETLVATSSETGEFRLSGLAPGRYRVEARAPGYASVVLPSVPIPYEARLTLVLLPSGQLSGVVLRRDGQPAAGAEVLAMSWDHDAMAFADGEGRFSLDAPAGVYFLSARAGEEAGTLEQDVRVAAGQRVQGLRLQLGAGAWLSGKVVRKKDGSPMPGARVEGWPEQRLTAYRPHPSSAMAGTDANGAFSFPALTPGPYHLEVSPPIGGARVEQSVTLAAGEHASVTISVDDTPSTDLPPQPGPPSLVQGRIVNTLGLPVRHVLLTIIAPSLDGAHSFYELTGEWFELRDFPPGPSQLVIHADDLRAAIRLELQPGEHKILEIPVRPGVALRGRLIDATTREPVAGASVFLSIFGSAVTSRDGRFSFQDVPSGELSLYVTRGSSQTVYPVRLAPEQGNDVGDIAVPAP